MLTPRQEQLLAKVVDGFAESGLPVGSKALAADHADLVAPPMFVVVYTSPAIGPAMLDPEVGIDFARMVHGAQEFAWGPLVVTGDEITTEVEVADVSERGGMAFFVFESRSDNQDGDRVCTGTWTCIVRGAEDGGT